MGTHVTGTEDLTDSAAFFSAELTAEESVQKGIQAFSALIKSNPSVEIAARANNSLSRLYLSVDSLHAAFQSCLELQKSPFANQYDEDVLFRMGQIALRLKNEVLADSLFEKIQRPFGESSNRLQYHASRW